MTHPSRYLPVKAQKPIRGTMLNKTHPLARGLVGAWVMNEGAGDIVNDLAARNNGSLTSTNVYWRDGGLFSNTNNVGVQITGLNPIPQTYGSISCWAYKSWTRTDSNAHVLYRFGDADASDIIDFVKWSDNSWYIGWYPGSSQRIVSAAWDFAVNTWTHLVLTWNDVANQQYLYENGALALSKVDTLITSVCGGGSTLLEDPRLNQALPWNGGIRDVLIYDRVLSPSEISQLHAQPYCMF